VGPAGPLLRFARVRCRVGPPCWVHPLPIRVLVHVTAAQAPYVRRGPCRSSPTSADCVATSLQLLRGLFATRGLAAAPPTSLATIKRACQNPSTPTPCCCAYSSCRQRVAVSAPCHDPPALALDFQWTPGGLSRHAEVGQGVLSPGAPPVVTEFLAGARIRPASTSAVNCYNRRALLW
jgi:hypothetical protein